MPRFVRDLSIICVIAVAATIALAPPIYAQRGRGGGGGVPPEVLKAQQEEEEFNTLLRAPDADKKIKLGEQFLKNYPTSKHAVAVYNQIVNIYYSRQDWTDFYATADKTIAIYPDDVDVLTLVGWVIPHKDDPNDSDFDKKLDKAESYEKHAIELITPMSKPVGVTDDEFASTKTIRLSQAHSGLGLVYFRKQNWDGSVKELQEAIAVESPDPTDLFALAYGLEQLSHYSEAAEAYDKCSLTPSLLQGRCKSSADDARAHIAQAK